MINGRFEIKAARLILAIVGLSLIVLGVAVLTSSWLDNLMLSAISFWKRVPPAPHWLNKLRILGVKSMLSGVFTVIFGWSVLPRWPKKERFILAAALLVLVALWLPVVLFGCSATIAGERYWWLSDDSMISMRYARNLADGIGLVWNPGEKVEGYTNFLWTIYMALVHLLPIPASKTSLIVLLTNIALAAATIPLIIRFVRILGGGALATVTTLAAYVLNENIMDWGVGGFETTLLTFLFLLVMYRVVQESQLNQPRISTYLFVGIISLVRADAAVLSALLCAVSLLLTKNRKAVVIYSALSLMLPVAHEIFRIYYYGDILPNTAYLKAMNWSGKYIAGLRYVLSFAKDYMFLIVFAVVGSIFSREWSRCFLLGALLPYTAYVVYVGGDAWGGSRFFIPVLPLLMVLAFVGIQGLGLRRPLRLAISILCLVTIPLSIPIYTFFSPSRGPWDIGNIRIGLLLKQNTPANSKVADFYAGSVFYFSERYGVDLLGKSDHHIAHLPTVSNGLKPGHNKFDFDYSLGIFKPDFVVAFFKLPVDEEKMRQEATGDLAFNGQLYLNSVFRAHYLPNPVSVETWRTIFVCDCSSHVEEKDNWEELPSEK